MAYVWIDGTMFNKTLLEEGYARVSTYPPNVKYVEEFRAIRTKARVNNRGFWSNNLFNGEDLVDKSNDNVKSTGMYVGSLESDKYHYPSCRYAKNIAEYNEIWFDTADEAKSLGFTPCGVCKP